MSQRTIIRTKSVCIIIGIFTAALSGCWSHNESGGSPIGRKQADIPPSQKGTSRTVTDSGEKPMPRGRATLAETVMIGENDLPVVTNPDSVTVVVNKQRNLPPDYKPQRLVAPNVRFSFAGKHPKMLMRQEAAAALERMFIAARRAGNRLAAVSGYRSYSSQIKLFQYYKKQQGETAANRTSAHPGQSEHQTGLAMDISCASLGYELDESFGETKEGKWLAANAADYGFIIRYPKGKESVTGYAYEPWHVRYVGQDVARELRDTGMTLEQYYAERS